MSYGIQSWLEAFSTAVHTPLLLLLALTTACAPATDDSGNASGGGRFRVALPTPGPISDQSSNTGAYAGLIHIRDSLDAQVSHIQTRTPAEFEENFRQYGSQGYDLVFGHGFEFQDAAVRVAPAHPRTLYVTISGNQVRDKVAGMTFAFEETQAARERGGNVHVIGSNADQNAIAPEVTLGSVVIDLPHALLTVAREVSTGRFTPRVVALGSREEVVRWVPNPRIEHRVPAEARERVRALQEQMRAGTFEVEGLDYAFPRNSAGGAMIDSAPPAASPGESS